MDKTKTPAFVVILYGKAFTTPVIKGVYHHLADAILEFSYVIDMYRDKGFTCYHEVNKDNHICYLYVDSKQVIVTPEKDIRIDSISDLYITVEIVKSSIY